ncbi:hypothetical protein XANMN_11065 [Xanthomonas phaseoli pv. manihotis str. CIO151]|nr:hypothetical protein XANMN_11065 [Xanthomonas phaseoli pv. manihotis str. CIO151]
MCDADMWCALSLEGTRAQDAAGAGQARSVRCAVARSPKTIATDLRPLEDSRQCSAGATMVVAMRGCGSCRTDGWPILLPCSLSGR